MAGRRTSGPVKHRGQVVPALGERPDPAAIALAVGAEAVGGRVDRAGGRAGPAAVERVGEGDLGLQPAQPVALERQGAQDGEPAPRGWMAEHTSWRSPAG